MVHEHSLSFLYKVSNQFRQYEKNTWMIPDVVDIPVFVQVINVCFLMC